MPDTSLTCLACVLNFFQGCGAVEVGKGECRQFGAALGFTRIDVNGRLSGAVAIFRKKFRPFFVTLKQENETV